MVCMHCVVSYDSSCDLASSCLVYNNESDAC